MSENRDAVQAGLIAVLRQDLANTRSLLNISQQQVELLASALEPFSALYHETMDARVEPTIPILEHPIPRLLRYAHLKQARLAFERAMLPTLETASNASAVLVEVWCDGSGTTMDSAAGCGVVVQLPEIARVERGIPLGKGTNNFAELHAIRHAILLLQSLHVPTHATIRLYSDSEYAIGALTKAWEVKANAELIDDTRAGCRRFPGLSLVHVRGHSGNEGNEAADRLAGASAAAQTVVYSVAKAIEIMRDRKTAMRDLKAAKGHKVPA